MSTLTISTFTIPNCQYSGTVMLRVYYWPEFIASDNTTVMAGAVGSQNFFIDIECELDEDAAELTVPEFELTTTDDSLPTGSIHSTATGVFYVNNAQRDFLFSQFTIPASLTPTTEFAALRIYNTAVVLTYPSLFFLTREQVAALIGLTPPALHASTHENGGSDEINVTGLGGVLADPQVPITETVQDIAGGMATDSTSVNLDYDDALATITATRAALTGDVTASANSNATTIANDVVTFAKMQNIATDSLIGRDTASSGDPENILLNATLSMDGAGNLQRAALTGDVTASAGSNSTTIPNDTVTFAKMQNVAANSVPARAAGTSGDLSEVALSASQLLGRGDSGNVAAISLGANLTMTGTTLAAAGASGYTTVEDEGVGLTQRTTINFTGDGVSAADSGGKTVVTIAGGGSLDIVAVWGLTY